MRKVFNEDSILITDLKKMLQEIEKVYSDLYNTDSLIPSENVVNFYLEIPRLTEVDAKTCEGKLTTEEYL